MDGGSKDRPSKKADGLSSLHGREPTLSEHVAHRHLQRSSTLGELANVSACLSFGFKKPLPRRTWATHRLGPGIAHRILQIFEHSIALLASLSVNMPCASMTCNGTAEIETTRCRSVGRHVSSSSPLLGIGQRRSLTLGGAEKVAEPPVGL